MTVMTLMTCLPAVSNVRHDSGYTTMPIIKRKVVLYIVSLRVTMNKIGMYVWSE